MYDVYALLIEGEEIAFLPLYSLFLPIFTMIRFLKHFGPILLLTIAPLAQATLEADLVTTRGTVTVVLEPEKAPMAVANLITLAQGSVSWRDASNGAVRRQPMYDGLAFDEVSNTTTLKLAAIGDADAGYQFPDEFPSSLTHEPYVLAMSNDGPNTNSGRFYFTGNLALPMRDNHYTLFGKIPAATGRAVIDAILAAGPGATSMVSITIRRTDATALAFDEMAIPLPRVSAVNEPITVEPGVAVKLLFNQPPLSVLQVASSTDLVSWTSAHSSVLGMDSPPASSSQVFDDGVAPKKFYQTSLSRYPNSPVPPGAGSFANRTLTVTTAETGDLIYHFDSTGLAGTYENIIIPGLPPLFQGNFQLQQDLVPFFGLWSFRILIHANGLGGSPFNLIRGGFDGLSSSVVNGRVQISMVDATKTSSTDYEGTLVLSGH